MKRNLQLAKIIFSLNLAWFWLGIWVPYYLLFTNYAGIGLIETLVVLSAFLLELPTGALTDLIGKKRALQLVFILTMIGDFIMANATDLWHIFVSVVFLGTAASFLSGTQDAFLYDSLIVLKKENQFETIRSQIQKYSLIAMAIASAIGGWLYTISPPLPFLTQVFVHGICLVLTFWLTEPPIDTIKFTLKNYISQMKHGLAQLFSSSHELKWIFQLIIIGAFAKFLIEGLDPALALGLGVTEIQLGYLFAIIPLISAAGAHWYEKKQATYTAQTWWNLIIASLIIGSIISPILGTIGGISFLLVRNIFYPILETITASTINNFVDSQYRATTLSAFSMIESLPYIVGATAVGWVIDQYSAALGVGLLSVLFVALLLMLQIPYIKKRIA